MALLQAHCGTSGSDRGGTVDGGASGMREAGVSRTMEGGASMSGSGSTGIGRSGSSSGSSGGSGNASTSGSAASGDGGEAGCPAAPAAAGETVTSVADMWPFTPSGGSATVTAVTGGGWVAQGFGNVSSARYEQTLKIPDLGRPQATYLEFGAINHQATLAVDGKTIGTNTTSFTPSVFNVTSVAKPGMSQDFVVDVKGRKALLGASGKKLVPDAAGWSPNIAQGIFRSAALHVMPALHIADTLVEADVANQKFSVDVWVTNDGSTVANGTVDVALSSATCDPFDYPTMPSVPVSVAAGMTTEVTVGPVAWGLGPSSYWWPNVPYTPGYRSKLHYAAVTVTPDSAGGGSAAAHSIPVRFGFRQIQQVGPYYELNGVRVNFRGDDIQGADYDSITNAGTHGPGDAYDLFPGFLAPSSTNAGWPGAVDNWQRLNYNVSRLHQEPVTPYMLDVMDEMGFMAIEESAIRGSNNDQDFAAGLSNMVGHLSALIHRDRNHPAIIRWSQDNEPENDSTNSPAFQQQLYQAATAGDDTRPISADSIGSNAASMNGYPITASNFTVMEHYPSGFADFTGRVDTTSARPFGVGEYIWSADNTKQGLAWFATSTMALRQQDASDLRPYTLLSGWASFVPGVRTTMMSIEQGGPPLFGEDNLPDPWSNPILVRIQRAFNPVAVVDVAYWTANEQSDKQGDWPVSMPTVSAGSKVTRQLMVFNDTFSGTAVDLSWEMHQDSATGAISDQGSQTLTVPLGQRSTVGITVTAPSSGTKAVLVLTSSKNGQQIFTDDAETFTLQ